MNIKNKNSISLLSNLFDSYLIDKDNRFLEITSSLTGSIIKNYSQKMLPPSATFDKILSDLKLDHLKAIYPDIYNGINFILDYKQPSVKPIMEDLTTIGLSKNASFYAALLIAPHIINDKEIKDKFFKNNVLLNFLYSKTSKGTNNIDDVFAYLKLLKYTSADFGGKKFSSKEVLDFFEKVKSNNIAKKQKGGNIPLSPTPSTQKQPKVSSTEYKKAFNSGWEKGIIDFESYGKNVVDIKNIIDKTINPKMLEIEKELYEYIIKNENKLRVESITNFTRACYLLVSLTAINSDKREIIDKCYKTMNNSFKNWDELKSLAYLKNNRYTAKMIDAQKAEKIYKIINPIIIQNIIKSIPESKTKEYNSFISDLRSGYLTSIYDFCNKYKNIIGIMDSSKMAQSDFVIDNLSNKDVQTCVKLIMQRIEGYTHFLQTAENPDFVETLKKEKSIEELNSNDDKKISIPVDNNTPIQNWFNAETIKMAGAFLYQLYLAINERTDR